MHRLNWLKNWLKNRLKSPAFILLVVLALLITVFWSQMINWMMPSDSRPGTINYSIETATPEGFETAVAALEATRRGAAGEFKHIARFREAGIRGYDGPATCLGCHRDISVDDGRQACDAATPT